MLSSELWLDFIPAAWIVYPALAWRYKRFGDLARSRKCLLILGLITFLALIYITIKFKFGLDNSFATKGQESDLIFNYGEKYILLAFEDFISSYFTLFFTIITTYFPPELFSYSLSSWIYGPEKIVALQEGYHSQATHLVHYNHLFLWRFYAGSFLAIFIMLYFKVISKFISRFSTHDIILFVLMTCILVGSPTHLLVKWRPMLAAPFLGYKCTLSIMSFTLLICYLVTQKAMKFESYCGRMLFLLLASSNFIYCAYARPALLSHMAQESFMPTYPDPRKNIPALYTDSN